MCVLKYNNIDSNCPEKKRFPKGKYCLGKLYFRERFAFLYYWQYYEMK